MRAAFAFFVFLGALAACDQLNKPMAVPNGNLNVNLGGTSGSSSGAPDAASDAMPPPPAVAPQPGDTQL